jgi:hypothetical protein
MEKINMATKISAKVNAADGSCPCPSKGCLPAKRRQTSLVAACLTFNCMTIYREFLAKPLHPEPFAMPAIKISHIPLCFQGLAS